MEGSEANRGEGCLVQYGLSWREGKVKSSGSLLDEAEADIINVVNYSEREAMGVNLSARMSLEARNIHHK